MKIKTVGVNLRIEYTEGYPNQIPNLSLVESFGIPNNILSDLSNKILTQVKELHLEYYFFHIHLFSVI